MVNRIFHNRVIRIVLAVLLFVLSPVPALVEDEKTSTPAVEVVFVLDTTGSMGGLIEGAKQKIWSIVNKIAGGKPTPTIKIGLVAYRDLGDEYVTKVTDLSEDLDAIFKTLKSFCASGGGDTPESVNQGLNEAVTKIKWSLDKKTLKIIFLVGDCPPHMDYQNDVKYQETCKDAVTKEIIINTVQCGNISDTARIWQEIARLGEGSYIQIAQSGGVVTVATPYDEKLGKLARDMDKTTVFSGEKKEREKAAKILEDSADSAESLSAPAAADRAEFKAKSASVSGGHYAESDLVDKAEKGELDLSQYSEERLPEEMKKMSKEEQEKYIAAKVEERKKIKIKIEELSKQRDEYIKKELEKNGKAKDSFDNKVMDSIKEQASKKGIKYED
ncbi:MAG: VWA domain-containing protein [Planctomycetota bacterium]